jgi:hypothetical protein
VVQAWTGRNLLRAARLFSIRATLEPDISNDAAAARFAQVPKEYIERDHGLLSKE